MHELEVANAMPPSQPTISTMAAELVVFAACPCGLVTSPSGDAEKPLTGKWTSCSRGSRNLVTQALTGKMDLWGSAHFCS